MNTPLSADVPRPIQPLGDHSPSPPVDPFEKTTSLAIRLLDVSFAIVCLAQGKPESNSISLSGNRGEHTRDFCTRAMLADEIVVVPDATVDDRLKDNPLVTGESHIRFYAGVPLQTPQGYNVGALCVFGTAPRQLSSEQRKVLKEIASVVVDELELLQVSQHLKGTEFTLQQSELALRRNGIELRESLRKNTQLIMAITHLSSGVVITDPHLPDNPLTFANDGFSQITGYQREEVIGRNCRFLQGKDTDSQIVKEMREAIAERRAFHGVLCNYKKDGTPFINELIINPVFDSKNQLISFVAVQNDVTERENAKQLLEERVYDRTLELSLSKLEILERLAQAAELRDDDTGQHTQRVSHTSALIAKALGWADEQVTLIAHAAVLHDVGKIAIPDLILLKPGKLTEQEFAIMKTHTTTGASLLHNGRSEAIQMAERIAVSHHERFDGKGYPNQLAGTQIPIEGRVVSVADVFDALTHGRPYKAAWKVDEAVAEIQRQSGLQLDPDVVRAFLTLNHEELI